MTPQGPFTIIAIQADALPGVHKRDGCRKCSCINGYLARYIKNNGTVAIRWVCDWCDDYGTASDLPKALLGGVTREAIPLRVDHSDEPSAWPDCVVCGHQSQEFHHWAPQAIFPDWPYDLGAPLCLAHHREWHDRMRTHGLRWPHELNDAA